MNIYEETPPVSSGCKVNVNRLYPPYTQISVQFCLRLSEALLRQFINSIWLYCYPIELF